MLYSTHSLINDDIYWHILKNILVYDILYKTLNGAKPLRIRLNKIDGFVRNYDGTRYLVLFGPDKIMMSFTIELVILLE